MAPEDPVTQEADRHLASSKPNPAQQQVVEWAKVFVVPVTVAVIGLFGTTWLEKRQSIETNTRLYVELVSKREEADSALRKDLFNLIVKMFLESSGDDLKRRVLALELLAYNFHESLDISPLFKQAHKDIKEADFSDTDKGQLLKRMRKLAREVIDKQIAALSPSSNSNVSGVLRGNFDVATLEAQPTGIEAIPSEAAGGPNRTFSVLVVGHDVVSREVQVQLEVKENNDIIVSRTFHVGPFDFPMLDNTRLPDGQRVAVVLTDFFEEGAEIALVYFPASRASLKEKPYYDELLRDMLAAQPK